ncbi:hypothetical protein BDV96DRAFT_584529 [Lophiotrema nucula]|uniref:Uncharacterized protein n=1 Tax=Lophiotrema nucula TaxID=690887 RepID=A0A6A5YT52_9PLEO|nr:hypothetical protein BDV96DRAFT_584529 [Lophiotrema nucula]
MNRKRHEDALTRLSAAYNAGLQENATKALNVSLRKSLRLWAAHERLRFTQDDVGNIYVVRTGRDPELASIAVTFPLDSTLSLSSFIGAFDTFFNLQSESLVCDVTLLGWTSPGGELIGQRVWEGSMSRDEAQMLVPDIQQFSGMDSTTAFALSAAFEVLATGSDRLTVKGSPVLVTKVCQEAENEVDVERATGTALRAPVVSLQGVKAVSVAQKVVVLYSEYVAALFDNFD